MLQEILEQGFLNFSLACSSFEPCARTLSHLEVRLLSQGVIEFVPHTPSTSAYVLSCGVHGNETAPIELCERLIEAILIEEIVPCHRLQVQFAHLPAMAAGLRFIQDNMNRQFSQTHAPSSQASYEVKRAWQLQQLTQQFFAAPSVHQKFHFDLHTSIRRSKYPLFAVYPLQKAQTYAASLLNFLAKSDIKAVLLSQQKTSTYSMFSTELGAQALTLELGEVRPFGQNDLVALKPFWSRLLACLTEPNAQEEQTAVPELDYFQVYEALMRDTDDFSFNFSDHLENFTPFKQGEILAFRGGEAFKAPRDIAVVFPNPNVEIGERAALLVHLISSEALQVY